MATDSGLVYLSGLLRAGAEPLGPVGGGPRRRAAAPPRSLTSPHAPPSYSSAPSDRSVADEAPHSPGTDAAARVTHATASQPGAGEASAGHVFPATSGEAIFAGQSEDFAASRPAPTNTALDEDATESAAPSVQPSHAPPRTRAASAPTPNAESGVENQSGEKVSDYVTPSPAPGARSAEWGYESTTPAASAPSSLEPSASDAEYESMTAPSLVAGAAVEARAARQEETHGQSSPGEEIRVEETEHTTFVTEHAAVAASEIERPSGAPRRLTVEWSPAPLQEETFNASAPHDAIAPATEVTTTTRDANTAATDPASIVPTTSSARGVAARHEQPSRGSHAPAEEGARRRHESDADPAVESGAARAGGSAEGVADSTLYTLEAHVEQLRALMQTRRAETPGGAGENTVGAAQPAVAATAKETPTPHAPVWRARESPRGEQRAEFAAPSAAASPPKSDSRQSIVPESPEQRSTARSRRTSAAETPPSVSPAGGAQKTGAGAATHGPKVKRPSAHVSPARVGVAQPREGGRPGEIKADGARTPKLTINRLDVQVVNRTEPQPPPARPARPAPASPSQTDPWGAPDRHFLGRFFY